MARKEHPLEADRDVADAADARTRFADQDRVRNRDFNLIARAQTPFVRELAVDVGRSFRPDANRLDRLTLRKRLSVTSGRGRLSSPRGYRSLRHSVRIYVMILSICSDVSSSANDGMMGEKPRPWPPA